MKYIDAEKLIAEIERLEHENCMNGGEHFCMRRAICLGNLRNIASPIYHEQQEQPEVDLEKEFDKVWNNGLSDELAGPHNNFDICARLARHFYKLGKEDKK